MAKVIMKIDVYANGKLDFKPAKKGDPKPKEVEHTDMDGFKMKQISKNRHVPIFHANPTWVFIGGRWVRIG